MAVSVAIEAPEAANLLDLDPELSAAVGATGNPVMRRACAATLVTLPAGRLDIPALLSERGAHAALLLEGLVVQRIVIGGQASVELLGGGDMLTGVGPLEREFSLLTPSIGWTCAKDTRIALLPPSIAYAAARWPALGAALRQRMETRHIRLSTLHAIAQIPRAEARLYLLLWLLAERFGRVTSEGVVLDVVLPYRTIGEMIGARRSTVSLAMKALRSSGSVAPRADGTVVLLGTPG